MTAVTPLNAYIARETAIGSVINLVIGSAFFLMLFRGQAEPQVWGPGGLILDCLPQGFMIGLMSVIPAMLITRKRVGAGLVLATAPATRALLPRGILARGLVVALATMVCLVAAAAALAWLSGVQSVPFWPAFALKALPGLLAPCLIIPPAIKVALSDRPRSPSIPT